MKQNAFPVDSLRLIITTLMLIGATQSDADMTLPYNGNANVDTGAVFRINNDGKALAIHGRSIDGAAIAGFNYERIGPGAKLISRGTLAYSNYGVYGMCHRNTDPCTGVRGWSAYRTGVVGETSSGVAGVKGEHNNGNIGYLGKDKYGVMGESLDNLGVYGKSEKSNGVQGYSQDKVGVYGKSEKSNGVQAWSEDGDQALWAEHRSGAICRLATKKREGRENYAVYAENPSGSGIYAKTDEKDSYAVLGWNKRRDNIGYLGKDTAGVYGKSSDGYAGEFIGKVSVKVLEITGGSDLSEQFRISTRSKHLQKITGMVVSIDPDSPGELMVSNQAYDRKVAGIISGAGGLNPGMVMGQENTVVDGANPVALSGRVYCLADASNGAITPGDLLTTSNTVGHAMKVEDYGKAQGAILGKAMTGLQKDRGLVLVLVTLQ
jgi:hypothetical protein